MVESTTLADLSRSIGESFVKSLALIASCKGRIIFTGMGKSSLIAQKIVATFNSTGTPAIFMHASEAFHGDLGILQRDDIVVCLSKSGETDELKRLIPIIKNMGNPLIAVVAQPQSYLAQMSDIVISTPIVREADPNDLAPTASTMAQLAIGDSLAVCLISLKSFEAQDFAHLHPGGSLGKRLHLRVADLLQPANPPVVNIHASIKDVIFEISSKRLGATAVLDNSDQLQGVITDGDLRRMLERNSDLTHLQAEQIMSSNPKTISPEIMAVDAIKMMHEYNITQLLILKDGKYVGIIHIHDLLREGIG